MPKLGSRVSPAVDFAASVIPLLKEYSEKLHSLGQQAASCAKQNGHALDEADPLPFQARALREKFKRLKAPAVSLAQHVSQQLEHGDLDDIKSLELALRLAEFESELKFAETLVGRLNF